MDTATTQALAPAPDRSLVPLIREAMTSDVDPAKLSALLQVRREWEADEARKAFSRAITEFQRRAPIIPKDDKAYDKAYARIDRIWRTVRPLLTELGLSVTWQLCELRDGMCRVEGMLRHSDGHGEKLSQDIPMPELIKGQNKAQQMGSASTYAKRYAMCAALGIVTGDDDDGHAAGANYISSDQAGQIEYLLGECRATVANFNEDSFWRWLGLAESKSALDIPAARHADTVAMLNRKLGRQA